MSNIKNVIRQTLASLERKNIDAIPSAYEQEFQAISKILNFDYNDKKKLTKIVDRLPDDEQKILKEHDIISFEEIVYLLLKRAPINKVKKVSNLLTKSLQSSISLSSNEELNKFTIKIGDSPELLFKNDIQMEIKKLIERRIKSDNEILHKKTDEIFTLVNLIHNHIDNAVEINDDGFVNIQEITKKLENMDKPTIHNISKMQNELVNTANSIQTQMQNTNDKLNNSKNDINKLKEKIKKLENELSSTKKENEIDHLTSVLTRKAFEKHLIDVDEKYKRTGQKYAVIFFDIDHFKKVNDTYGHKGGDHVLSTFAKVILRSTRDADLLGRYGGEEFICILNYKEEIELEHYIKRVKKLITTNRFKFNEHKIAITFSAGLTLRDKNENYQSAIELADELLYKAKNSGRNKIIFQNGIEI